MSRRTLILAAIALAAAAALALFLATRPILAIDRCLDAGGRWNHESALCEGTAG